MLASVSLRQAAERKLRGAGQITSPRRNFIGRRLLLPSYCSLYVPISLWPRNRCENVADILADLPLFRCCYLAVSAAVNLLFFAVSNVKTLIFSRR
jgi:hypothetical protein